MKASRCNSNKILGNSAPAVENSLPYVCQHTVHLRCNGYNYIADGRF